MKYLVPIIILIFSFSCRNNKDDRDANDKDVFVSGIMDEGKDKSLLFQQILPDGKISLDSIMINEKDKFSFRYKIRETGFYSITNEGGNSLTLICSPGDSLFLKSSYFNFRNYSISGSRDNELLTSLNTHTQKFLEEISGFSRIVQDSVNSPNYSSLRMKIDKEYHEAFDSLKAFSEELIYENPGSLVSLLALTNQLGQNFYVFHPVNDSRIFEFVDSSLSKQYPDNLAVANLHVQLAKIKPGRQVQDKNTLKPGDPAPVINLPDTAGIMHELSFVKNEITLVVFWASWCDECRTINDELMNIFDTYSRHGLGIYQVSLDESMENWKKAIQKDELPWLQVSDLKFWNSEAVKSFQVESIPYIIMINNEGKVIFLNSSPGLIKKQIEETLPN